jgi:hypothetical protein
MANPASRTHYLNITSFGTTFISKAVLVGDRPGADIGHNFHIGMRMRRETRLGLDDVVIPDADRAPIHAGWVIIIRERKMVVGVKPSMICCAQTFKRADFNSGFVIGHNVTPSKGWMS